jgi:hypothetical protein
MEVEMRMVEMKLLVSEDRVMTIYDVVRGYAECVSIIPAQTKRHVRRYANGVHNKGISGRDLVMQTVANGIVSFREMELAFKANGFASSSASPAVSALKAEGKVSVVAGRISRVEL